ncbi:MAG: GNAT family N-acetyltransferase [Bacteriovorax sp.]|nr:GNAT family N-acetyltransferase [Bacteriovorax sp.]
MAYHAWHGGRSQEVYLKDCRLIEINQKGEHYVLANVNGELHSRLIVHPLQNIGIKNSVGLGSIATPPELQNKGYASELIRGIIQILSEQRIEHIFLYSDLSPEFYARFEFQILPNQFQKQENSICMVRTQSFDLLINNPKICLLPYL